MADYELYCHYVAGLVGIGLSQLFASSGRGSCFICTHGCNGRSLLHPWVQRRGPALLCPPPLAMHALRAAPTHPNPTPPPPPPPSGLESPEFSSLDDLSNQMGLFLQKTNIIRDYLVGTAGLCRVWRGSGLGGGAGRGRAGARSNWMGLFLQKTNIIRDYLVGFAVFSRGVVWGVGEQPGGLFLRKTIIIRGYLVGFFP